MLLLLIATSVAHGGTDLIGQRAIDTRRDYLECLADQIPMSEKPTSLPSSSINWPSKLSERQQELVNKARQACGAKRVDAIAASLSQKAMRPTNERAYDLRLRVEEELDLVEQRRIRHMFMIGWVE